MFPAVRRHIKLLEGAAAGENSGGFGCGFSAGPEGWEEQPVSTPTPTTSTAIATRSFIIATTCFRYEMISD